MDVYVVNVEKTKAGDVLSQKSFFTIAVADSLEAAKNCVEKFISLITTSGIGKVLYYYGDS